MALFTCCKIQKGRAKYLSEERFQVQNSVAASDILLAWGRYLKDTTLFPASCLRGYIIRHGSQSWVDGTISGGRGHVTGAFQVTGYRCRHLRTIQQRLTSTNSSKTD